MGWIAYMNTATGEILQFKPGETIPAGFVGLNRLPNPGCKVCKGNGAIRRLTKRPGRRGEIVHQYVPCECTQ